MSIAVRCDYSRAPTVTSMFALESSSSTGDIVVKKDPIARIDGKMTYNIGHVPLTLDTCDGSFLSSVNPSSASLLLRTVGDTNNG